MESYRSSSENMVFLIDSLGNVITSRDASRFKESSNNQSETQIKAVIDSIKNVAHTMGVTPRLLWKDPLPEVIELEKITGDEWFKDGKWPLNSGLSAVVGVLDDTVSQKQPLYNVDLTKGNIFVYDKQISNGELFLQTLTEAQATSTL